MKRPNILVICSDQHHPRYLGYDGHPFVETPNLDSLAHDGVVFDRAYCNSPVCTPSRMSFVSGQYIHQCRDWMIGVPSNPDTMTWGRQLHESGYHSALYGKLDFCGSYQDGGFSEFRAMLHRPAFGVYPRNTPFEPRLRGYKRPGKRELIERAGPVSQRVGPGLGMPREIGFYGHDLQVTEWAEEFLHARCGTGGVPWALYVGLLYPHWPFRVPSEYFDRYAPDRMKVPESACFPNEELHPALRRFQEACDFGELPANQVATTIAAYAGMVTAMDEMIGRILQALEESGHRDDTYVIYTSDHGESLAEHGLFYKQCSYESSVRVPLIVSGPGLRREARVSNPVSLVDMYPTIAQIAGMEVPPQSPGSSWLGVAAGDEYLGHDYAFSEFHGNFFPNAWYMLVKDDLKYTYYVNEAPTLYDLASDPGEMNDLSTRDEHAPVLDRFETLLRTIVDPERTDREAKADLGLLSPNGEDLTLTMSASELAQRRRRGEIQEEPPRVR